MSTTNTPDELFLDLDDLPTEEEVQDASLVGGVLPQAEIKPVVPAEPEVVEPQDEPAFANVVSDPFSFAMPRLDDALRADGVFQDEDSQPEQEDDSAPQFEIGEDVSMPGLEVVQPIAVEPVQPDERDPTPGPQEVFQVEEEVFLPAEAVAQPEAVSHEDDASVANEQEQQTPLAAVVSPTSPSFVPDPAGPAAHAPKSRRPQILLAGGAALAVVAVLVVLWALPISKESASPDPTVAVAPPEEETQELSPEPEPEPEPQPQEPVVLSPVDLVADVLAAPKPEPVAPAQPEAAKPASVAKPVVEKTTPAAKPKPKPAPKPVPEKRDWQDDALDSLDAFEKRL